MERRLLTDQERFVCIARWLNVLYSGYFFRCVVPEVGACLGCPQSDFCPSLTKKRIEELEFGDLVPTTEHFKILERFSGKDTIIGAMLPSRLVNEEINDIFLHRKDTFAESLE